MRPGGCKYSSVGADPGGAGRETKCGNPAYRDGLCKFHLDGYLNKRTASELRDMFWRQHDRTAEGDTVNCSGYILPSLVQGGGPRTARRRLCLDNAVFGPNGADFSEITFEEPASFKDAVFAKGANFHRCVFEKGADFSRAKFLGDAKFEGSRFSDYSRFAMATFDRASFDWARIAAVDFGKSAFKKAASFYESEFTAAADFRHATFRRESDFTGSNFDAAADFRHATFRRESDFTGSNFDAAADFEGAAFVGPMHFRGVRAKCPAMIKFDGNVSNVSFLDTDLKEITFGSRITWSPRAAGRSGSGRAATRRVGRSIWNKKWRVYDEKTAEEKTHDRALNVENLKNVYRDMRDNFDRRLAYGVSGGLFVREMEVERKYENDDKGRVRKKHLVRRILTWHAAYNLLSEYGQSLGRPMLCLAAVFGAGLSLLWCPTGISPALEIPCRVGLWDSVLCVLTSMVPIPLSTSHSEPELALKIASLPASATFLIALRRRFEKSRRH